MEKLKILSLFGKEINVFGEQDENLTIVGNGAKRIRKKKYTKK